MSSGDIIIELPDLSRGEANQSIEQLKDFIFRIAIAHNVDGEISASIFKSDHQSQDFGATLLLVIGTPAALAVAKGVHDFIASYGHKVIISVNGQTIVAHGNAASNIDIAATVAALQKNTGA